MKNLKTNKELNTEYDKREQARVRPKQIEYKFKELEAVIRQWILKSHE